MFFGGNCLKKNVHMTSASLTRLLTGKPKFIPLSGNLKEQNGRARTRRLFAANKQHEFPASVWEGDQGDLHLTPWKTSGSLTSPASNYQEQVL